MTESTTSNPLGVLTPLICLRGIVTHLQDCNPENLENSFNIKTPILKVSTSSRLKS